jgi:hypothetical protein
MLNYFFPSKINENIMMERYEKAEIIKRQTKEKKEKNLEEIFEKAEIIRQQTENFENKEIIRQQNENFENKEELKKFIIALREIIFHVIKNEINIASSSGQYYVMIFMKREYFIGLNMDWYNVSYDTKNMYNNFKFREMWNDEIAKNIIDEVIEILKEKKYQCDYYENCEDSSKNSWKISW